MTVLTVLFYTREATAQLILLPLSSQPLVAGTDSSVVKAKGSRFFMMDQ